MGLAARVAQHELDHLDGILILDRTTKEARREALARRCGRRPVLGTGEPEAPIGVAATAPLGADVLEQLAAHHDVAFVFRHAGHARRGRGRRVGATADEGDGGAARHPRAPARAARRGGREVDVPTMVVCGLRGALIPSVLLDRAASG